MTKKCIMCGNENLRPKSIYCSVSCYEKEYRLSGRRKKVYSKYNKTKKARNLQLKYNYGISLAEYTNMIESCGNKCMICGKPEVGKNLSVDHCHVTGKVRGLLCGKCNRLIGLSDENINILKNTIKYLS